MEKKGYSREGFWGETIHYDADGNKVGESRKNFAGGYDHYDANGNKVGSSHQNFWGGVNHYDTNGEKSGSSYQGFWGQTNHFDAEGEKVGESTQNFWGGRNHYGMNTEHPDESGVNVNSGATSNTPKPPTGESTYTSSNTQHSHSKKHTSNGFDELLATVAVAGFILFILGALLRWENILLYLVVFLVSLVWFIIRNK